MPILGSRSRIMLELGASPSFKTLRSRIICTTNDTKYAVFKHATSKENNIDDTDDHDGNMFFKKPEPVSEKHQLFENRQVTDVEYSCKFDIWKPVLTKDGKLSIKGKVKGIINCAVLISEPIIYRINKWLVVGSEGVFLLGSFNNSGLPVFIAEKFKHGIPQDWSNVCKVWFKYILEGQPRCFIWKENPSQNNGRSSDTEVERNYLADTETDCEDNVDSGCNKRKNFSSPVRYSSWDCASADRVSPGTIAPFVRRKRMFQKGDHSINKDIAKDHFQETPRNTSKSFKRNKSSFYESLSLSQEHPSHCDSEISLRDLSSEQLHDISGGGFLNNGINFSSTPFVRNNVIQVPCGKDKTPGGQKYSPKLVGNYAQINKHIPQLFTQTDLNRIVQSPCEDQSSISLSPTSACKSSCSSSNKQITRYNEFQKSHRKRRNKSICSDFSEQEMELNNSQMKGKTKPMSSSGSPPLKKSSPHKQLGQSEAESFSSDNDEKSPSGQPRKQKHSTNQDYVLCTRSCRETANSKAKEMKTSHETEALTGHNLIKPQSLQNKKKLEMHNQISNNNPLQKSSSSEFSDVGHSSNEKHARKKVVKSKLHKSNLNLSVSKDTSQRKQLENSSSKSSSNINQDKVVDVPESSNNFCEIGGKTTVKIPESRNEFKMLKHLLPDVVLEDIRHLNVEKEDSGPKTLSKWFPVLISMPKLAIALKGSLASGKVCLTKTLETRLRNRHIKTSDGQEYYLVGAATDSSRDTPPAILHFFKTGIPQMWENILERWKNGEFHRESKGNPEIPGSYCDGSVASSSSLSTVRDIAGLSLSRSGRILKPRLSYWLGERGKNSHTFSLQISTVSSIKDTPAVRRRNVTATEPILDIQKDISKNNGKSKVAHDGFKVPVPLTRKAARLCSDSKKGENIRPEDNPSNEVIFEPILNIDRQIENNFEGIAGRKEPFNENREQLTSSKRMCIPDDSLRNKVDRSKKTVPAEDILSTSMNSDRNSLQNPLVENINEPKRKSFRSRSSGTVNSHVNCMHNALKGNINQLEKRSLRSRSSNAIESIVPTSVYSHKDATQIAVKESINQPKKKNLRSRSLGAVEGIVPTPVNSHVDGSQDTLKENINQPIKKCLRSRSSNAVGGIEQTSINFHIDNSQNALKENIPQPKKKNLKSRSSNIVENIIPTSINSVRNVLGKNIKRSEKDLESGKSLTNGQIKSSRKRRRIQKRFHNSSGDSEKHSPAELEKHVTKVKSTLENPKKVDRRQTANDIKRSAKKITKSNNNNILRDQEIEKSVAVELENRLGRKKSEFSNQKDLKMTKEYHKKNGKRGKSIMPMELTDNEEIAVKDNIANAQLKLYASHAKKQTEKSSCSEKIEGSDEISVERWKRKKTTRNKIQKKGPKGRSQTSATAIGVSQKKKSEVKKSQKGPPRTIKQRKEMNEKLLRMRKSAAVNNDFFGDPGCPINIYESNSHKVVTYSDIINDTKNNHCGSDISGCSAITPPVKYIGKIVHNEVLVTPVRTPPIEPPIYKKSNALNLLQTQVQAPVTAQSRIPATSCNVLEDPADIRRLMEKERKRDFTVPGFDIHLQYAGDNADSDTSFNDESVVSSMF